MFESPKIDVVAGSGMLRVTVHPRPHWLVALVNLGMVGFFALVLYKRWSLFPVLLRVIWMLALVSTVPVLMYQFFGEEIIEFGAQKLTIRKGVHGWERKREYQIEDCRELEWEQGREGKETGLKCKVGWRAIRFGGDLSESDSIEILTALQQTLPDVAQKICAYPGSKEHFTTLGLNRR